MTDSTVGTIRARDNATFGDPSTFALIEHGGEPHIRDVELGERLGMNRPRDIRQLIEANREEIEAFGPLRVATAMVSRPQGGGRSATEYLLNEDQALCVATLSRAPRAADVRRMLILTFSAFRRGQLDNSIGVLNRIERLIDDKMALVQQKLDLLERLSEERRAHDDRVSVLDYRSALEILKEQGIPQEGRRGFVRSMTSSLQTFCAAEGVVPRRCARTTTWLYPAEIVPKWWKQTGRRKLEEHLAKKLRQAQPSRQGELRLVVPRKSA